MKPRFHELVIGGLLLMIAPNAWAQSEYDYIRLIKESYDLNQLAHLPEEGERSGMFSSYDRATKLTEDGKQVDWFSTNDKGHYLRKDPDGFVMAEMDGPGVITRIFATNPGGQILFYLDRKKEPQIAGDLRELLSPTPESPRMRPYVTRQGKAYSWYLPIPFQRHCKIVVQNPPEDLVYQINYRTFNEDTKIPTKSLDEIIATHKSVVEFGAARLIDDPKRIQGQLVSGDNIQLEPGDESETDLLGGPARWYSFYVTVDADDVNQALRDVQVTVNFDRSEIPQISAPIGDFFGASPGMHNFITNPVAVFQKRLFSKVRMPYHIGAVVRFTNQGKQNVTIKFQRTVTAWEPNIPSGRFNAKWVKTKPGFKGEWELINIKGKGQLVGVLLTAWNPPEKKEQWWGLGAERVYIDGEKFPSYMGTGTDHFFGLTNGDNTVMDHPFFAQSLAEGPGFANHTTKVRWFFLDQIIFHESLKLTLEKLDPDTEYSATVYYYADEGSTDNHEAVPIEKRTPRPLQRGFLVKGGLEAEQFLQLQGQPENISAVPEDMKAHEGLWSDNSHLLWPAEDAGQWIDIAGFGSDGSEKSFIVHLTKGPNFGQVQFSVKGKPIGKPVDCYAEKIMPSGPIDLGKVKLEIGAPILRLQTVGKNEQSKGYQVGLDCIKME